MATVLDTQKKPVIEQGTEAQDVSAPIAQPRTLAEIQNLFQCAIVDGNNQILNSITDNGRTTADVLLGVYQYAYRARLIDILADDYACLFAYMGKNDFREMADAYVAAHPSTTANVRWFGRKLSKFLSTTPDYRARKEYSDLAALENALANAFDAADDAVLSLSKLKSVEPEDWTRLVFKKHGSAAYIRSHYDLYELWQGLQGGEETSPTIVKRDSEVQHLIVWRKNETARVRVMNSEEAMMWQEACQGTPFGRLCELVATFDDAETAALRAAQYLQSWVDAELLTGFNILR